MCLHFLRIVCATFIFGMRVDTPGVHKIIHLGAPSDIPVYIQETGRGGRDGKLTTAVLLIVAFTSKGLLTGCVSSSSSKEMLEGVKNGEHQLFFTLEALLMQ